MRVLILFLVYLISGVSIIGQDELKWKETVEALKAIEYNFPEREDVFVLSGSSSALMWKNIGDYFPEQNIINNGFGGSQMHELLFFIDDLIINYSPSKIFIYEGDNDISAGKSKKEILETTRTVIRKIRENLPKAEIYFISPKPSLARWNLKTQYLELNDALKALCEEKENVFYIDVWFPMLNDEGAPKKEIFIQDGLHMNKLGYDIWAKQVAPYITK